RSASMSASRVQALGGGNPSRRFTLRRRALPVSTARAGPRFALATCPARPRPRATDWRARRARPLWARPAPGLLSDPDMLRAALALLLASARPPLDAAALARLL